MPLAGKIQVDGSKNAALPIIFSSIAIPGVSRLVGVPKISDVDISLDILCNMGATVTYDGDTLVINTKDLTYRAPDASAVSKIRASSYLIGACLARFGRAKVQPFGGCNFDTRPIDMHLAAATAFGADLVGDDLTAPSLRAADVYFDKVSVGATINAIIMASTAKGASRIFGYAKEPHVIALVEFLRSAGADITLLDDHVLIRGRELSNASATVIPDMIEAGTYITLSLMSGGAVTVGGACISHLASYLDILRQGGAEIFLTGSDIVARGRISRPISVSTAPYPGFPTDLQPIIAPLLAFSAGGEIREGVFLGRFGYLAELSKFGVQYELYDGYAKILNSKLHSAIATAPDLRGGAALMLSALAAEGESVINNADLVWRGYANVLQKLQTVGAQILNI